MDEKNGATFNESRDKLEEDQSSKALSTDLSIYSMPKESCSKDDEENEDEEEDSISTSDDENDENFVFKPETKGNDYNDTNDFDLDDEEDSIDLDFIDQMLEEKYSSKKNDGDEEDDDMDIVDQLLEENVNLDNFKQSEKKRKHDQIESNIEHQEKKRIMLISKFYLY